MKPLTQAQVALVPKAMFSLNSQQAKNVNVCIKLHENNEYVLVCLWPRQYMKHPCTKRFVVVYLEVKLNRVSCVSPGDLMHLSACARPRCGDKDTRILAFQRSKALIFVTEALCSLELLRTSHHQPPPGHPITPGIHSPWGSCSSHRWCQVSYGWLFIRCIKDL